MIGELLKNQFRIGLARSEKNIKDKMSTTTFADATPASIKYATTWALLRFGFTIITMDQIPLAELTQKACIAWYRGLARDRAGVEVRDVHNSHYGRICPIETPEGPSIGLISSLATYGKVDEYGFIQTPYFVVKKEFGAHNEPILIATNETKYLTADEEFQETIASASSL